MEKRPLLFMHAPPEHIPHVINASVLYSGLKDVYGLNPIWVTMNVIDTKKLLPTKEFISKLGLEELLEFSNTEVENCFEFIKDEMNPKAEELEEFIIKNNPSVVYLYYFPQFWWPIIQVCRKHKIPIGIHVQVNYIYNNENFIFDNIANGRRALIEADFLTVSQEKEKTDLEYYLDMNKDKIKVIDKSIPSKVLADVVNGINDNNFDSLYTDISEIIKNGKKNIGYIGRLDDIKNIHWFIDRCMPKLSQHLDKFNLILIGDGNRYKEIENLSKNYKNIYLLRKKLSYKNTLTFLKKLDLVLFPSGYDLTPRLPLEALAVGTAVILGEFNFNDTYKDKAIIVAEGKKAICNLDYTGYKAEYGIPDSNIMINELIKFINSDEKIGIDYNIMKESVNPLNNIKSFYNAIEEYLQ